VLLVLLIACVNVANLLLARGSQRRAEFAMRAALGAPQGRLARQLLTESLLLATCGRRAGHGGCRGRRARLARFSARPACPGSTQSPLTAVFLFAFALTTFIGMPWGWSPIGKPRAPICTPRCAKVPARTTGSRHWTRRTLVVTEVSLAVVLLVSAGLLLRSMKRLFAVDPGFDTSHLVTMQVQESGHRYPRATPRASILPTGARQNSQHSRRCLRGPHQPTAAQRRSGRLRHPV
jgi:putative ABC transport system permease protein